MKFNTNKYLMQFAGYFFMMVLLSILLQSSVWAQAPQAFNYQAIIRNNFGVSIPNRPVRIQVGLQQGLSGPFLYQEQHIDTTNSDGLVILHIGRGTLVNNSLAFTTINWANHPYYINLSIDTIGNGPFMNMGSFELLSVPYAFYSGNGMPAGSQRGEMLQWNGTSWVPISIGSQNEVLRVCGGIPTWSISGQCPGSLTALNCGTAVHNGTLTESMVASSVNSVISYTGGSGGPYNGLIIPSTGVTGLTATLNAGTFATGNGTLTFTINGTPNTMGTANFTVTIGGQTCTFSRTVSSIWRNGMVHCSFRTQVVAVTNPTTNKTWMDRNLGATRVATSLIDTVAHGDLYQWGRFGDGHQCRTSLTTTTLSSSDSPGNGNFIVTSTPTSDWRSPQNNSLWQGVNGINNPCPLGYRIPTDAELDAERLSWSQNNRNGAFASPLKFSLGGNRGFSSGDLQEMGDAGYIWSSTVSTTNARSLYIQSTAYLMNSTPRARGCSVRCIMN